MRVALVEMYAQDQMATGERGRALAAFLRANACHVDVLAPDKARLADFYRFRFSLWSRLKRRTLGRRALPHLWDYLADELEPRIRAGAYDVVIARLQPVAYVLTRLSGCVKVFDSANIGFLETYHGWNADLSELDAEYEREMSIYRSADAVILHHEILAGFFRHHVYDAPKVRAIRMGCYPMSARARYSSAPRLVYAGSYEYLQDPYLLAILSTQSPFPLDCFGKTDPNHPFLPGRLNYRGFQPTTVFLADYQAGVITVSQDRLRRHSPSTKFAYYFACGLPVLFPDWMLEGHTYPAAIPFTETSFADQAKGICRREDRWRELSELATATARDLSWDHVLEPFLTVIGAGRRAT